MSELVRIGLARGNSSHQASMQLPTLITYFFKDFLPSKGASRTVKV